MGHRRLITYYAIINGSATASPDALRLLQTGYTFKVEQIQKQTRPSKQDYERLHWGLSFLKTLSKRLN